MSDNHNEADDALAGWLRRAIGPDRLKVSVHADDVTIQLTREQAEALARRLGASS